MKALMKLSKGKGNVILKDIPEPIPGEGYALIKVKVAGVCGTDVHIYHDRFPNSPQFILGHEFSGTIERLGPGVKTFQMGDRVVSENNPFACGTCKICSLGYPNLCPHKKAMGIHSDGCFAACVKLPVNLLHHIPDNISFEEAALCATGQTWRDRLLLRRRGVEKGDTVVVFGPGAIGLLSSQVAKAEGADKILLIGTSQDEEVRFECAIKLGIETLDIDKEDLIERIMSLTQGVGADVVIEASGSKTAIIQGIELLRKNGRMAISGITGQKEVPLNWDRMVSKGLSLFFAFGSRRQNWERALKLLSRKKVKTLPLITHRFRIEEWEEAFHTMETLRAIRPVFIME